MSFLVDDIWNSIVVPVPFLKNQVDTTCVSQEFLYKCFLWSDQLTVNMHSSALSSRISCLLLKDRASARASIKPTGILHGWGQPRGDPYVTTFQRCSLKSGRSNMTEMFNRTVCQDDVTGRMFWFLQ